VPHFLPRAAHATIRSLFLPLEDWDSNPNGHKPLLPSQSLPLRGTQSVSILATAPLSLSLLSLPAAVSLPQPPRRAARRRPSLRRCSIYRPAGRCFIVLNPTDLRLGPFEGAGAALGVQWDWRRAVVSYLAPCGGGAGARTALGEPRSGHGCRLSSAAVWRPRKRENTSPPPPLPSPRRQLGPRGGRERARPGFMGNVLNLEKVPRLRSFCRICRSNHVLKSICIHYT
jgi:hypothetical protein